jgi:hypothetical protein
MAMTTCRECTGAVSDAAEVCPHCGIIAPAEALARGMVESVDDVRRTVTALVLLAVIGLVLLAAAAGVKALRGQGEAAPFPDSAIGKTKQRAVKVCEDYVVDDLAKPAATDGDFVRQMIRAEGRSMSQGPESYNVTVDGFVTIGNDAGKATYDCVVTWDGTGWGLRSLDKR